MAQELNPQRIENGREAIRILRALRAALDSSAVYRAMVRSSREAAAMEIRARILLSKEHELDVKDGSFLVDDRGWCDECNSLHSVSPLYGKAGGL